MPDKIKVPAPTLVKLKVDPETTPETVNEPLPPILELDAIATVPAHVEAVPELLTKAPPLEMPVPFNVNDSVADDVNEKPFISKTPPELTVVPVVEPNGPVVPEVELTPSLNVAPLLIVVVPVYPFAADNCMIPAPRTVTVADVATVPLDKRICPVKFVTPPEVTASRFNGCVFPI